MGRAMRGGADWHKFGSFAEHLLAHTWVSDARRRLNSDETYDDETYAALSKMSDAQYRNLVNAGEYVPLRLSGATDGSISTRSS